jgi:indolepyruvate ferredoxin oxidoreductase alpha subunit
MGVPGLINVGYNKGNIVTIVFDNRTTGMTGHQDHPGTGKTLMGETTRIIKVEELARACGIERVYVLDPYKIKENRRLIREIFAEEGPAVIVSSRPCALLVPRKEAKRIISELCNGCKLCLQLGCPAIMFKEEKAVIQDAFCVGCGMCQELCQKGAIV